MNKVASYISNLGKSVAYSAIDVAKEYNKPIASFTETNQELFKEIYTATRNYRTTIKKAGGIIKNSKIYDAADLFKKSLMEDLATGKWYNKEREDAINLRAMGKMGDMSMDDADISFGDDDWDFSDDDDWGMSDEEETVIEKSIRTSADQTSEVIARTGEYVVENSRAEMSMLYSQNTQMMHTMGNGFQAINESIGQIVDFTSGPLQTHLENSTKFYETASNLLQEQNAMIKEMLEMQRNVYNAQKPKKNNNKKLGFNDITDGEGMPDLKAYAQVIKKNMKNAMGSTGDMLLGDTFGEGSNVLLTFASSPMKTITNFIAKSMVPAAVSKAFDNFSQSLSGAFGAVIAQLNKAANDDESGLLLKKIGEIFGIRSSLKSSLNTGNYQKGAVPFDGITRKSITEVIPGHLRKIESLLSGKSERVYDYNNGKWTNAKDLSTQFKNIEKQNVSSATYDMREYTGKFIDSMEFQRKADRDELIKGMEKIFTKIYKDGGAFRPNGKNPADQYYDYGVSEEVFRTFLAYWKSMPNRYRMNMSTNMMRSRANQTAQMERMEEEGYSPYLELFNGANPYIRPEDHKLPKGVSTKDGNALLDNNILRILDDKGHNAFYYMQNLLKEVMVIRNSVLKGVPGGGGAEGPIPPTVQPTPTSSTLDIQDINDLVQIPNESPVSAVHRESEKKRMEESKFMDRQRAFRRKNPNAITYDTSLGSDVLIGQIRGNAEVRSLMLESEDLQDNYIDKGTWLQRMANDRIKDSRKRLKESGDRQIQNDPNTPGADRRKSWWQRDNNNNSLLDRLMAADTLSKKWDVITVSLADIAKKPEEFLVNTMQKADKRLYTLIYGDDNSNNDRTARGFLDAMLLQLKNTFQRTNEWLDENILGPLKDKLGIEDFRDLPKKILSFFGMEEVPGKIKDKFVGEDGIFRPFIDSTKQLMEEAYQATKKSMKDAYQPVTDAVLGSESEREANAEARRQRMEVQNRLNERNSLLDRHGYSPIDFDRAPGLAHLTPEEREQYEENRREREYNKIISKQRAREREEQSARDNKDRTALEKLLSRENRIRTTYGTNNPSMAERGISNARREMESIIDTWGLERPEVQENAEGARYITKSGLTTISKGEMIIPSEMNPLNPNRFSVNKKAEIANEKRIKGKATDYISGMIGEKFTEKDIPDNDYISNMIRENATGQDTPDNDTTPEPAPLGKQAIDELVGGTKKVYRHLFGDDDESKQNKLWKDITSNIKEYAPQAFSHGLLGAGLSLVTGMVGGPLVGAAAGAAVGIARKSKVMQDMLFGKELEDGGRDDSGIIKGSTQAKIKKYLPDLKTYGIAGAVTGLITPFGPIGGLMIGSAVAYAKNNEYIQEKLFGEDGGLISKDAQAKVKKAAPKMLAGSIATLFLGPFGIVGNAALGAGLGFLSSTDTFQNVIFGEADEDGKRNGGLLGVVRDSVIKPLKDFGTTILNQTKEFFENDIIKPLKEAIDPISTAFKNMFGTIADGATGILNRIFERTLGVPLETIFKDKFIDPLMKISLGTAKLLLAPAKAVISSPFKAIGAVGNTLRHGQIMKGRATYTENAAERMAWRQDHGIRKGMSNLFFRDKTEEFDRTLMNSDKETIGTLRDQVGQLVEGSDKHFSKQEKSSKQQVAKDVMQFFDDSRQSGFFKDKTRKQLLEAINAGDMEKAEILIRTKRGMDGKKLSKEDQDELSAKLRKSGAELQNIKDRRQNAGDVNKEGIMQALKEAGIRNASPKQLKNIYKYLDIEYKDRNKNEPTEFGEDDPNQEFRDISEQIADSYKTQTDRLISALDMYNRQLIEIRTGVRQEGTGTPEDTPEDLVGLTQGQIRAATNRNTSADSMADSLRRTDETYDDARRSALISGDNAYSEEAITGMLDHMHARPELSGLIIKRKNQGKALTPEVINLIADTDKETFKRIEKLSERLPIDEQMISIITTMTKKQYNRILKMLNANVRIKTIDDLKLAVKLKDDMVDKVIFLQKNYKDRLDFQQMVAFDYATYIRMRDNPGEHRYQLDRQYPRRDRTQTEEESSSIDEAREEAVEETREVLNETNIEENAMGKKIVRGAGNRYSVVSSGEMVIPASQNGEGMQRAFEQNAETSQSMAETAEDQLNVQEDSRGILGSIKDTLSKFYHSAKETSLTKLTEYGPLRFRRAADGSEEFANDATTTRTRKALDAANSAKNNIMGVLSDFGNMFKNTFTKDKEETKGGYLKRLLKTAGKGILKTVGALTVIGAVPIAYDWMKNTLAPKIQNWWENDAAPYVKEKVTDVVDTAGNIAIKGADAVDYLINKLVNWFRGTGDFVNNGLPELWQEKIIPFYAGGIEVVFTKLLPMTISTLVKALPAVVLGAIKGLNSLMAITWSDIREGFRATRQDVTEEKLGVAHVNSFDNNMQTGKFGETMRKVFHKDNPSGMDNGSPIKIQDPTSNKTKTGTDQQFNPTPPANVQIFKSSDGTAYYTDENGNNIATTLEAYLAQFNGQQAPLAITESGNQIDPDTGLEIDPKTGYLISSDGKELIDKTTGYRYDIETLERTYPLTAAEQIKKLAISTGQSVYNNMSINPLDNETSLGESLVMSHVRRAAIGGGKRSVAEAIADRGYRGVFSNGLARAVPNAVGNVVSGAARLYTLPGNAIARVVNPSFAGRAAATVAQNAGGSVARNAGEEATEAALRTATTEAGEAVARNAGEEAVEAAARNAASGAVEGAVRGAASEVGESTITSTLRTKITSLFNIGKIKEQIIKILVKSGREGTESAFKKFVKSVVDKTIGRLMKSITKRIAKSFLNALANSNPYTLVAFAIADFTSGMYNADVIMSIKDPSFLERVFCGLAKALNGRFLLWGLIDVGILFDILIEIILPILGVDVSGITDRRDELAKEVEEYNKANGEELTVEEYLKKDKITTKITTGVKNAWKGAKNLGSNIVEGTKEFVTSIPETIGAGVGNLWEGAKNLGNKAIGGVKQFGSNVATGAAQIATNAQEWGKAQLEAINSSWTKFKQDTVNKASEMANSVSAGWDNIKGGATKAFNWFGETSKKAFNVIDDSLGAMFGMRDKDGNHKSLTETYKMAWDETIEYFGQDGLTFGKVVSDGWGRMKEIGSTSFDIIKEGARNAFGVLDRTLGGLFGLKDENGESKSLTESIKFNWGKTIDKAGEDSFLAGNVVTRGWDAIKDTSSKLMESLTKGIKAAGDVINKKIGALFGFIDENGNPMSLTDGIEYNWDKFTKEASSGWKNFTSGITGAWENIKGWFGGNGPGPNLKIKKDNTASGYGPGPGGHIYQKDGSLANVPYNRPDDTVKQTIGDSGCAPVAATQVINSLQPNMPITPQTAAEYAIEGNFKQRNGGTTPNYFNSIFNQFGIPNVSTKSPKDIKQRLQDGNRVVLLGRDVAESTLTPFGGSPHYVVATGMDNNGQVIIQDPYSREANSKYNFDAIANKVTSGIAVQPNASAGGYGLFPAVELNDANDPGGIIRASSAQYAKKVEDYNNSMKELESQVGNASTTPTADNTASIQVKATDPTSVQNAKDSIKPGSVFNNITSDMLGKQAGSVGEDPSKSTVSDASRSATNPDDIVHQNLGVFSKVTADDMNTWINKKAPNDSRFRGKGYVFIRASAESGLDPRYILAHAALESGWGNSSIAIKKNNYFGIGAFDISPYQSAYSFADGLDAGVVEGAKWISRNYYNSSYHQTTLYKMRYNNGVHQYATDDNWHTKIAKIMRDGPTNYNRSYDAVPVDGKYDAGNTNGESGVDTNSKKMGLSEVISTVFTNVLKKTYGNDLVDFFTTGIETNPNAADPNLANPQTGATPSNTPKVGENPAGKSADEWFLSTLKPNYQMTNKFSQVSSGGVKHKGIDYSNSQSGAPIYSPISGIVTRVVEDYGKTGYGNHVRIQDANGYTHIFAHMQQRSPLQEGQTISQGQLVGYVGNTGNVRGQTGNHLHYEVQKPDKQSINPNDYLRTFSSSGYGPGVEGTTVDLTKPVDTTSKKVSFSSLMGEGIKSAFKNTLEKSGVGSDWYEFLTSGIETNPNAKKESDLIPIKSDRDLDREYSTSAANKAKGNTGGYNEPPDYTKVLLKMLDVIIAIGKNSDKLNDIAVILNEKLELGIPKKDLESGKETKNAINQAQATLIELNNGKNPRNGIATEFASRDVDYLLTTMNALATE